MFRLLTSTAPAVRSASACFVSSSHSAEDQLKPALAVLLLLLLVSESTLPGSFTCTFLFWVYLFFLANYFHIPYTFVMFVMFTNTPFFISCHRTKTESPSYLVNINRSISLFTSLFLSFCLIHGYILTFLSGLSRHEDSRTPELKALSYLGYQIG